jgi:hypothetical protein
MVVSMSKLALMTASDRSNLRCGGFRYSAFAETFRAIRGMDLATRLRWLFDLPGPLQAGQTTSVKASRGLFIAINH